MFSNGHNNIKISDNKKDYKWRTHNNCKLKVHTIIIDLTIKFFVKATQQWVEVQCIHYGIDDPNVCSAQLSYSV